MEMETHEDYCEWRESIFLNVYDCFNNSIDILINWAILRLIQLYLIICLIAWRCILDLKQTIANSLSFNSIISLLKCPTLLFNLNFVM